MNSFLKEFKAFAMRGNVVDMAVGIIIGAAFGKIVSSFVDKIVMPPLGLLIGGVDFRDLQLTLQEAAGSTPAIILGYGAFIQTVIDFTIIAFSIFLAVKLMNRLKEKAPPPPPAKPSAEVELLREIRDLLKDGGKARK